ncbi:MAG: hypothetical protein HQL14_01500 [Candidatus Omnitrophica bacterium]|nr:hypothetical protein [Candidatus Omnitrophota bacterium]
MFRPLKKLNNESGVVLFTVLMTSIIIMIISASILSQSMNEINFAQQQIDEISSQELADGMFWNGYSSTAGLQAAAISQTEQFRTYQAAVAQGGAVPAGHLYTMTSTYDSFQ